MCRPCILSVHPIYWWRPFSRSRMSELDILFTNQGAHYLSNGLLTNPLKDKWETVSTSRQVVDRLRSQEHEDLNQNQKFLPPPPHTLNIDFPLLFVVHLVLIYFRISISIRPMCFNFRRFSWAWVWFSSSINENCRNVVHCFFLVRFFIPRLKHFCILYHTIPVFDILIYICSWS